jgi:hypothetical protein
MQKDNLGDWRIAAVTTLAQDVPAAFPGGPAHKAGAPVYLSSVTKHPDHNVIGFITPSATALALNAAVKNACKAKELKETLTLGDTLTPWGNGKSVITENLSHLYDFFEHCMIAVITSFQSLEMFSNDVISRELKGTFQLGRSKEILKLTGEELERRASTDEKLGAILPRLLAIKTPKGTKVWERYLDLKAARDATVHFKSLETRSGQNIDRESLFFQFFRRDSTEFPRMAMEVIEYFHATKELSRWGKAAKELIEARPI